GVATTAGVFLSLTSLAVLWALLVFFVVVALTRYVSLGSISAALTALVIEFIRNYRSEFSHLPTLILLGIMVLFIIWRHKSNINRLLHGTENKISFSKKGKTA
ncbi:MAG: glycerol-3-phosphate acyltransferase, partial [Candidatus Cloacimonetes bacterium]|nr:glycerol-3-phosphate acyltransferase [Candidatus Cloacimonadota bacterium]